MTDYLSALWKQHYPYQLYVKSKMKNVLDDNKPSKPSALVLKTDKCAALNGGDKKVDSPLLFLALGDRTESRASFYDFVMWYLKGRTPASTSMARTPTAFAMTKKRSKQLSFQRKKGSSRTSSMSYPVIRFRFTTLIRPRTAVQNPRSEEYRRGKGNRKGYPLHHCNRQRSNGFQRNQRR